MSGIYLPVASGTIAAANIIVTLTAGSADVDLSSATIPRNYRGHLLKIYDANNVGIQGFVYTDGAGTVQNIVSAKGGTTRNWAQQGAGFDDTTNCRYEILKVLNAPVVATAALTARNALMDTTTANAFAAPVGVDLTAYQDGRHILALYNTTGGYAAIGHISATAPGGENYVDQFPPSDLQAGWVDNLDGTYTGSNTSLSMYKAAGVVGGYYKAIFTIDSVTGGVVYSQFGGESGLTKGTIGSLTTYKNQTVNTVLYLRATAFSGVVSGLSFSRLTMPAATGALLLSTKGGARGYLYKHASFDPIAAMTYKVLFVGD